EVPEPVRKSMAMWVGCIAGALDEADYRSRLAEAGFQDISMEPTRVYEVEDARQFLEDAGINVDAIAEETAGSLMSAFVRATKPAGACCGPSCCKS
ncbi:MAG TPA: arsenite S-adenosylmethyltransferase, partial [Terracidiphilus sp.]|nr:arsenite S-adenosylmethyltransferase [Terracidiphilus sp.]